jgi:hypothetical protein
MNILPIVFVMLAMMSIMTYARLQSFLNRSLIQNEFECYVQVIEQYDANQAQLEQYNDHKGASQQKPTPDPDQNNGKVQADRYLNFGLFVNKQERESKQQWAGTAYEITRQLILNLYEEKPFYSEILEQNPDFTDHLLRTLMDKADQQKEFVKISKPKDMANLVLDDPIMQETWAKMLKGTPHQQAALLACQKLTPMELEVYKQMQSYPSLADYIRVTKQVKPLRIYLTPEPILQAIFKDERIVQEIVQQRHQLYLDVHSKRKSNEDATNEFKRSFSGKIPRQYDPTFFDFSVTQTET